MDLTLDWRVNASGSDAQVKFPYHAGMSNRGDEDALLLELDAIVEQGAAAAFALERPSDPQALLGRFESWRNEAARLDVEALLGALDERSSRLTSRLATASEDLRHAAVRWEVATLAGEPAPELGRPRMPARAVGFVLQRRLARAALAARQSLVLARYQRLADASAACDCAARVSAGYFEGDPRGPLTPVEATWQRVFACGACGTSWVKEEVEDEGVRVTSWSTWTEGAAGRS